MKWILLMFLFHSNGGAGFGSVTFETRSGCEAAAAAAEKKVNGMAYYVRAFCVADR